MEAAPVLRHNLAGRDAQLVRPDAHDVAWMELTPAPELGLAVDRHLSVGDQRLGGGASGGATGKLQELAEANHVA